IADFNGDGIPDLAVANEGTGPNYTNGGLSVLFGNGDGTFQPATPYAAGGRPLSVVVGDFNRDGVPDLAVTNYLPPGTVSALRGNGDGTFQPAVQYAAGPFAYGLSIRTRIRIMIHALHTTRRRYPHPTAGAAAHRPVAGGPRPPGDGLALRRRLVGPAHRRPS